MDDFVREYFSMDRLKKTYECTFNPITSKDGWLRVDLDYKIHKPKLRRKPGRPRNSRIKSYDEASMLVLCKVTNKIHKHTDTAVVFTHEYSRISYPLRNVSTLSTGSGSSKDTHLCRKDRTERTS